MTPPDTLGGEPPAPLAALSPEALGVLTWAVRAGAALAPRGPAGVALLAPQLGGRARQLAVPPGVTVALGAEWRALRAGLDATYSALGGRAVPGWPQVPPVMWTVCAWADAVRATFGDDEAAAWTAHAARHAAAGAPTWCAVAFAVDDVLRGSALARGFLDDIVRAVAAERGGAHRARTA